MAVKKSRRIFKPLVFIASLLPLAWLVWALYSDSALGTKLMTSDPVQKLNRELGDWALLFIIFTLAVRPIADISRVRDIVAYRRMIGLFAFFYAAMHLTSYVAIDLRFEWAIFIEDVTKRVFIILGIITLTLLTPLALTSTKGMIKRLGARNWRRLHWLIYPISILGVTHFYMMIRADFSRPVMYGTAIFVLLAYRIWKRKPAPAGRRRKETATA